MPLEHRSNDKVSSASLPTLTSSIAFSKKWATWWLKFPILLLILIITNILSFIFGFTPIPQNVPIIGVIKQYIVVMITIAALLAVITAIALIIKYSSGTIFTGKNKLQRSKWAATLAIFLVILFIFETSMLGTVLIRPSWCPSTLCFSPPLGTRGNHDDNLDVYQEVTQSSYFVIPGDPANYLQREPPQQKAAVLLDKPTPYRIVVGVHSLQQGRYGLIIEKVNIRIHSSLSRPCPLNIWDHNIGIDYTHNLYLATYNGQTKEGDIITAKDSYLPLYPLHPQVELQPGESDDMTVQIVSHRLADIQFHLEITYRVNNEATSHVLLVPGTFEVVFSNVSNWHGYSFQNGHFVKAFSDTSDC